MKCKICGTKLIHTEPARSCGCCFDCHGATEGEDNALWEAFMEITNNEKWTMKIKTYQKSTNIKAILISEENGFKASRLETTYLINNEVSQNVYLIWYKDDDDDYLIKLIEHLLLDDEDWEEVENWYKEKYFKKYYLVWNEDNEKDKWLVDKETFEKTYKEVI